MVKSNKSLWLWLLELFNNLLWLFFFLSSFLLETYSNDELICLIYDDVFLFLFFYYYGEIESLCIVVLDLLCSDI